MAMILKSKLPKVGTNIFTTMSGLAMEHNAINLGQGFPDFPMDGRLHDLLANAMRDGHNQYSPMPGLMSLRESISEKIEFLYGSVISPDTEITITPGGTYAIYTSFTAILQPGDEVIVPEPCYDSYIPNIEVNGGVPVFVPMKFPDYSIDWNAIRAAITAKTKAIIFNTPQNPTGTVFSSSDIEELRKTVQGTNIFIISDEVYEHLIYDGKAHESILKYPDLYERSFVCFSFGKTYNCTGWKMGYCVAPKDLTKEFRKIHQFNCFSCFTPEQVALASFLKNKQAYLELKISMQSMRDYFVEQMKQTRFTMKPSYGSYFICGTYEKISDEPDKDLAIRLTKEIGVAAIPVSAFYHDSKDDRVLRFCFSKRKETIDAAIERLAKI